MKYKTLINLFNAIEMKEARGYGALHTGVDVFEVGHQVHVQALTFEVDMHARDEGCEVLVEADAV